MLRNVVSAMLCLSVAACETPFFGGDRMLPTSYSAAYGSAPYPSAPPRLRYDDVRVAYGEPMPVSNPAPPAAPVSVVQPAPAAANKCSRYAIIQGSCLLATDPVTDAQQRRKEFEICMKADYDPTTINAPPGCV